MDVRDHDSDHLNRDTGSLASLPRVTAVERLLNQADGEITNTAIRSALAAAGRNDSAADVSNTLLHLGRSGKAVRLGRGRWKGERP